MMLASRSSARIGLTVSFIRHRSFDEQRWPSSVGALPCAEEAGMPPSQRRIEWIMNYDGGVNECCGYIFIHIHIYIYT